MGANLTYIVIQQLNNPRLTEIGHYLQVQWKGPPLCVRNTVMGVWYTSSRRGNVYYWAVEYDEVTFLDLSVAV